MTIVKIAAGGHPVNAPPAASDISWRRVAPKANIWGGESVFAAPRSAGGALDIAGFEPSHDAFELGRHPSEGHSRDAGEFLAARFVRLRHAEPPSFARSMAAARSPRKIRDSSLAHAGLLYAKSAGAGVLDACLDATCARFWRRARDITDSAAVSGVLAEADAAPAAVDYAWRGASVAGRSA